MAGQSNKGYETYYVPEQSSLAFFAALSLFLSVFGAGSIMNDMTFAKPGEDSNGWLILTAGLLFLLVTLFSWFRVTIVENRAGMNSAQLKRSYVIGMQWFIFSEVMFFAAFFGALWYVRSLVGPWLAGEGDGGRMNGLIWPGFDYNWPMMTTPQDAVGGAGSMPIANNGLMTGPGQHMSFPGWSNIFHWLPLWNTIFLVSSSVTLHIAHLGLLAGNRAKLNLWLSITLLLAFTFVACQYVEYHEAYAEYGLKLTSGIYGSTFFMLTGFHGFHVCMGAVMLSVQWIRAVRKGHFTAKDHFGFEASSWYWHFVDVVWVGLFLFVYIL